MNETTVTIVGNVSMDIAERRTMDGAKVVNFGVVSNERRYDKETGDWVDGDRFFAMVTCWRKLALGVAESLRKGDPVIITGRLYQDNYEIEGKKQTSIRIEASAVGPNLSRCTAEVHRGAPTESGYGVKSTNLGMIEGNTALGSEESSLVAAAI